MVQILVCHTREARYHLQLNYNATISCQQTHLNSKRRARICLGLPRPGFLRGLLSLEAAAAVSSTAVAGAVSLSPSRRTVKVRTLPGTAPRIARENSCSYSVSSKSTQTCPNIASARRLSVDLQDVVAHLDAANSRRTICVCTRAFTALRAGNTHKKQRTFVHDVGEHGIRRLHDAGALGDFDANVGATCSAQRSVSNAEIQ